MWRRLGLGVATSLIFLFMLIIRQYAIIFLALSRGIPVRSVTLYVIGGVPGIAREFTTPILDILLGAAGLLFSLVVVMLFYIVYVILVVNGSAIMASLVSWLVYFMVLFTFFHLIPGFPMDGGRIFRALLWRRNRDYDHSTRIAAWIGQAAGLCFIGFGLGLIVLNQRWIVGGVVAFFGWVAFIAAAKSNLMMRLRQYLLHTKLSDIVLSRECPPINSKVTIRQLVRDYVLAKGHYFFAVTDDGKPIGCISPREIRKIPKRYWDRMTVEQICKPATKIYRATAEQSAADILEQMLDMEIEQMPVLMGNDIIGVIDRDDLLHLTRIRRELKSLDTVNK